MSAHLNTEAFAAALCSGIYRVMGDQAGLNRINVFPVPDGDTGTNLSLSLGAALATLEASGNRPLGGLLAAVADELLDGSRGNSGAIVAQFFQGMSDAAAEVTEFTTRTFASAVAVGSDYAHDALANPREGTILSVIAAFARSLDEQVRREDGSRFAAVLPPALDATQNALARTTDQLDELRRAGVVDAGARGFVDLLEGMVDFLVHGQQPRKPDLEALAAGEEEFDTAGELAVGTYRYCTECIVSGTDLDRRRLRESIGAFGDSLVLAGSKRRAKIHIHTDEPEAIFRAARGFGDVSGEKADDMLRQQKSSHGDKTAFAVITDSAADIPDDLLEALDIHMVPLRLQFGTRGYMDKIGITPAEFFELLAAGSDHPTTSQPTPGDFRRQYEFLASHYRDVISVSLSRTVSGTQQAAEAAAGRVASGGSVHVLDSRNVSVGQGLLAILAAEGAQAGLDATQALDLLRDARTETRSFGLVRDLTYAVRGGRIPRSRKILADLLRLTPVLETTPDGRVAAAGVLPGRRNTLSRFASYVARRAGSGVRLLIGHGECLTDARELEKLLGVALPDAKCLGITAMGSALGVHAGPEALVVAVQKVRRIGSQEAAAVRAGAPQPV